MDALALLELSPVQLRVFLALSHLENRWGGPKAVSMDELSELTGYGRSAISRAVSGLADAEWIEVVRSKRNYGMLAKNKYRILGRPSSDTWSDVSEEPCASGETSTRSHVTTKSTKSISITKSTSKLKSAVPAEPHSAKAQREIAVVNRWSEDDDDLPGFGLLDSDLKPVVEKVSKRDAKTRNLRPRDEWTANDVASEFASRVYEKVRGIPGLVNTRGLAGALATNRKRFGVTAAQELAALEKFFSDERNLATIKKFPKGAHGVFLNAITKFLAEGHQTVGSPVDTVAVEDYVYASDGKKFDNSMPGRAALKRYEEKLKG
jgi:hypothetical protein